MCLKIVAIFLVRVLLCACLSEDLTTYFCSGMTFNYYRSTWCGTAVASMDKDKEIEACALVVAKLRQNRHWGGYVIAHRLKKHDHIGGDIRLNNDYFVERSLFNSKYNGTTNSILL
jgi:hypothetical protein